MKKHFIFLLFVSVQLIAQQDTYLALIDYQMPLINPAHAGADGQAFNFNSRNQWASIDQSPKTISFAYSLARGNNVGLGISVISDEVLLKNKLLCRLIFHIN